MTTARKLPTARQIARAFWGIPHEYGVRRNKMRDDAKQWEVYAVKPLDPITDGNPKVLAAFAVEDAADHYRRRVEDDARGKAVLRLFTVKRNAGES